MISIYSLLQCNYILSANILTMKTDHIQPEVHCNVFLNNQQWLLVRALQQQSCGWQRDKRSCIFQSMGFVFAFALDEGGLTQINKQGNFWMSNTHSMIGKKSRKMRYNTTRAWRLSLVCSHVRGWYKLQRVGGQGGMGEMFGSHTRIGGLWTRQRVWYMEWSWSTKILWGGAHICRSTLRKCVSLLGAWGSCGDQMSVLLSGNTQNGGTSWASPPKSSTSHTPLSISEFLTLSSHWP